MTETAAVPDLTGQRDPQGQVRTALVVGGFGALGAAVAAQLGSDGSRVLRTSRGARTGVPDAITLDDEQESLGGLPVLQSVVWAQGVNVNDRAGSHQDDDLSRMLEINVALVARHLRTLVEAKRLARGARLVVLSSIWEGVARPGKFSYTVSKAALGGLVRAAALDLAPQGILVNAVLPGVVDTPMTRAMLSAGQIQQVESATGFGRMILPQDVASLVGYLCSPLNTGVTGQSIVVDLGFSVGRLV
jgi:NAD(P)-dependent dehydrogenase (short-subunit alcohol dehydrogenase family)